MLTISLVYDHRGRVPGPVEVRITSGRKNYYVNTGIRIDRKNFVAGQIVNQADAYELNRRARIIYTRVQEEVNKYLEAGQAVDVGAIRRKVWQMQARQSSSTSALIDFVDEQRVQMQLRPGTLQHYITLRTRMREYGQLNTWDDLTIENLFRWDAWLHKIKRPMSDAARKAGEPEQYIGDGTVYNYHKCLKAILNRAVLFGKIEYNPYDRLRGKFRRGDKETPEFLTNDEMEAIESVHPVKGTKMAVVRELFVFQMHTGLSYADLQAFDFSEYKRVDGKWVNLGRRVKTGVQYVVMLTDECMRILEQYGRALPKIGNADYNHALKALGLAAGVSTPLHSHLARHSFATRAKALGIDLANIARMLGHSNTVQTQRYAKVLPEQVFADLRKIEKLTK